MKKIDYLVMKSKEALEQEKTCICSITIAVGNYPCECAHTAMGFHGNHRMMVDMLAELVKQFARDKKTSPGKILEELYDQLLTDVTMSKDDKTQLLVSVLNSIVRKAEERISNHE